ncbi:MAG: lycopene beta-cyclase [Spirosomataceae bacterium]|jgi:lycopene beta-cyclase
MKHYDYVICGGGMSGLSLAYYLINSKLKDKQILIIEPVEKDKNDRTWAFWEKGANPFEAIVYKKWDSVNFYNTDGEKQHLDIGEYRYKVIRGIDFYEFIIPKLRESERVTWVKDTVEKISDAENFTTVKTTSGKQFEASYVFDSTYKLKLNLPENYNLLQHFKGVVVQTEEPFFNPEVPDMMNFGVEQKNNECRFIYILPFDKSTALIEYTLFSESLLTPEDYDAELKDYISNNLKLPKYQILEDEFGVIPMSDVPTEEFPSAHVIRIGTAGGYTNPATGYTFQGTQKRLRALVSQLEVTGKPQSEAGWWQKRHLLYASVLLNVIKKKRYPIGEVFGQMYAQNKPEIMFSFLDGESNIFQELKLMASTPIKHFGLAAFDTVVRNLKRKLS